MTIHKFEYYFRPILAILDAEGELHRKELLALVCDGEKLNQEERELRNGRGTLIIGSRVHWSVSYLFQAGAVSRPDRGRIQITDIGRDLLRLHSEELSISDLRELEGMAAWRERTIAKREQRRIEGDDYDLPEHEVASRDSGQSPIEDLESAVSSIEEDVARELVARIHAQEPAFMEHVVLDLLLAMGYGGSLGGSEHLGRSGDMGVDGVIKQDALGLERIYVQAKRYAVGRNIAGADIQAFFGALHHFKAASGIFITTSEFTKDAKAFAEGTLPRIVLIDGLELGQLMLRHKVGVKVRQTIDLVEVDEDFFDRESAV